MINFFFNIIVEKITNLTKILTELNVTLFTLITDILDFFARKTLNLFNIVSVHSLNLASFFECYLLVMAKSTGKYFVTTWGY